MDHVQIFQNMFYVLHKTTICNMEETLPIQIIKFKKTNIILQNFLYHKNANNIIETKNPR